MRGQTSHAVRERSNGASTNRHPTGKRRLFTTAALLARKGRYAEATTLLTQARDTHACSEAEALDLQARIYAQQGLYLDAEACWRQAQTIDSTTRAYEAALTRLRRGRPSFAYWARIAAAIGMVAIMVALVWQVAIVQPNVWRHQEAMAAVLMTLRHELTAFNNIVQSRDQEMTSRVATLDLTLGEVATRLEAQLKTMPTVAHMTTNRTTLLERLDATGTHISQAVTAMEAHINPRLQTIEAEVRQRVEATEANILQELQSLPTAKDVARFGQVLVSLQEQLAQVVAAVEALPPESPIAQDVTQLAQSIMHLRAQLTQIAKAVEDLKAVHQAAPLTDQTR